MLMVVGLGPLALWMNIPAAFTVVVVLTILGIYGYQLWGMNTRFALLKWGQVAHVTGPQIISQVATTAAAAARPALCRADISASAVPT